MRWLITGCSDGLGKAIAAAAHGAGHDVIATARRVEVLARPIAASSGRWQTLPLDVTDPAGISRAVAEAGPVDVLVNNAGHGYLATSEEGEEDKIRRTFDVNFFGAARLIREVLPGMRARGGGTIINISSIAGFSAGPGSAYYAASKYALEGLSDALVAETRGMGIRVLIAAPGPIRTSFAGRSIMRSPRIPAYAAVAGARQDGILASDGQQAGDPDAIARLLCALVIEGGESARLFLGELAMQGAQAKLARTTRHLQAFSERSRATDFPS